MLGVARFFGEGTDLRFRPDDPVADDDLSNVAARLGETITLESPAMTRADFARWLYARIHLG
jgi:hypothetical protein